MSQCKNSESSEDHFRSRRDAYFRNRHTVDFSGYAHARHQNTQSSSDSTPASPESPPETPRPTSSSSAGSDDFWSTPYEYVKKRATVDFSTGLNRPQRPRARSPVHDYSQQFYGPGPQARQPAPQPQAAQDSRPKPNVHWGNTPKPSSQAHEEPSRDHPTSSQQPACDAFEAERRKARYSYTGMPNRKPVPPPRAQPAEQAKTRAYTTYENSPQAPPPPQSARQPRPSVCRTNRPGHPPRPCFSRGPPQEEPRAQPSEQTKPRAYTAFSAGYEGPPLAQQGSSKTANPYTPFWPCRGPPPPPNRPTSAASPPPSPPPSSPPPRTPTPPPAAPTPPVTTTKFNPYTTLNLPHTASSAKITRAHRLLSLRTHPDKLPPSATPAQRIAAHQDQQSLNRAVEILGDHALRMAYHAAGMEGLANTKEVREFRAYVQGMGERAVEQMFVRGQVPLA